jgi:predicted dehydrogenase
VKILKVGIAGYGVVGKRRANCINAHPNLELVAICDKNLEEGKSSQDSIDYYETYTDLIKTELDILFVCMSNDMTAEVTKAGLNRGLNIFCEKPPARNLEEMVSVIDCEKSNPGLKLMYGFNHRYHESVCEALEIVKSGALGKVINIRALYGKAKLITFNQPDWRTKRKLSGGGVLLDQGIHMVDLIGLFGGEFDDIHSFISNDYWGYDVEDNAYAIMRSKDGIVAMINSSATQWRHRFNLDINLEKGSLVLGGILSGTKSYGAETLTIVTADPDYDLGDPKEQLTRYNKDSSWQTEINLFTKSVINNTKISSGTSRDAFNTLKLVSKIYFNDKRWRNLYNIEDPDKFSI